jgi:tetratricopeptide (TPR) repeat protein
MNGRRLFYLVLPLLATALLLQLVRAERLLRASRMVGSVEQMTQNFLTSQPRRSPTKGRLRYNLDFLAEAGKLAPGWVHIPVNRGHQYLLLKRPQEAIQEFNQALEIEPRAEVYANLGTAYEMAGETAAARQAYEKMELLDPTLKPDLTSDDSRRKVAPQH